MALIVPNEDAVKESGVSAAELNKEIEKSVKGLNVKLPAYSKITACEVMAEPFAKTPKLSIKRFLYK